MAYDIYSQTPVYDGEGVRPQSDVEIEVELRNAARNGDLVVSKRNPLTGGVELNGVIVTMPSTPTIGTTADLAVGTLILSPAS